MKKLFLVLAIGSFVACNDGGSADQTKSDSTATPTVDTTAPAAADTTAPAPVADTTAKKDTTVKK